MKKFILSTVAILTLVAGIAYAGGNELAYKRVTELPTLTNTSVATGDFVPVFDATAGKVRKVIADILATTSTAAELSILDGVTSTATELNYLDLTGAVGTQEANKAVVADANVNTGISKVTQLHIGATGSETQVTSTGTELNLLDGAVEGNTVASKAALLDSAKAFRTDANVGTAGTGVTAVEYGDGFHHVTVLTVTAAALVPTTVPADAEGIGFAIYTFPAGVYMGDAIHADLTAFTGTGLAATNAVDFGLGSLIASGDIATLTTAAMEDWLTGQTIADISSPATEKSTIMTGGASLLFEAADSHVLNLNFAGTWNDTFTDPLATATIVIRWTHLGT